MSFQDDDLAVFAAEGAPPFPTVMRESHLTHDGARIWFADSGGDGAPVVLLHGGLGHSGNFGRQVPALLDAGYRVVAVDSRGHGRSTRDERPYSYERLASDVLAVLDACGIDRAALVGWSDGACTALVLAHRAPERAAGVFFFACNMDPSGTLELDEANPLLGRCFGRHVKDYAALSPTPQAFEALAEAVNRMQQTEPNYSVERLAEIRTPVRIVQGEDDEFIKRDHAEHLARTIPGADLQILPQVSHFAPLQRPDLFNAAVLDFLAHRARFGSP
jgi:pimeloyl-ACP methyl ester carboxylesterase